MFILGIAWAFGKASVFKYITDDYPHNIGTISGIVGLAGGLGGFVLPIMFGALMDLTGIRSSAFMLMYGVVWVSLIWMYWTEVRTHRACMGDERPGLAAGRASSHTATPQRRARMSTAASNGAAARPHAARSGPRRTRPSGSSEGEAIAKLNLWISVPALFLAFAIWQVWSVVAVSLPSLGFSYSTNQLFWLAAAPALSRRDAAHLLLASWCRWSAAGAGPRSRPPRC